MNWDEKISGTVVSNTTSKDRLKLFPAGSSTLKENVLFPPTRYPLVELFGLCQFSSSDS